ncbi:MAG: shikimate kinase [Clostridia bacterium]|nr:shikimate kinase [Clostridia bacterium]MBO7296124.1 shikimate kinase [Clostridia bacterium]
MSIILIGMPSCGKSTLGVLLAKKLGMEFIDSDLLIQKKHQKLLHELIKEHGNDGFLEIESEVNCSMTEQNAVIATGGSAVYSEAAMRHFATIGKIVYIHISYEEMEARLGDFAHRGVVMPEGYTLRDLYNERAALYEKYAHVTVSGEGGMTKAIERISTEI